MNAKRDVYKGDIVPKILYGVETWGVREVKRKQLDVFED